MKQIKTSPRGFGILPGYDNKYTLHCIEQAIYIYTVHVLHVFCCGNLMKYICILDAF